MARANRRQLTVVFFGSPEFALPSLNALRASEHELLTVVTQPDRPAGRGRRLTPPPVKGALEEWSEPRPPLLQVTNVNAPDVVEELRRLRPDLFVSAAFGQIFKPALLQVPALGCLNIHASLLPRYRGAAPVQHALLNGDTDTGVTIIWMDAGMDTGDILLQRTAAIGPDDTAAELLARLAGLGAEALMAALDLVARGEAPRTPQAKEQATAAPMISRIDAEIDWRRPANAIHNLVRAMHPRPRAYTYHRGRLLSILSTYLVDGATYGAGPPGEVAEILPHKGFLVQTGEGQLLITRVQPESRAPMAAAEYYRGYHLAVGDRLGPAKGGPG